MYLGLTPMLNHCRLSGSLNLLSISSPWCGWGIWLRSAARTGIYSELSLNSLFRTSRWLVMAVLAGKITLYENSADWVSTGLTHSRPLWPAPPRQASMICAWGPVTHGSFKKQRGEIFGWSWWGSGDVGGRQRGDGGSVRAGLSGVRQGRCGESEVQPWWQGSVCREDDCPSWTLSPPLGPPTTHTPTHPQPIPDAPPPPPPVSLRRQTLCSA